MNVYHNSQDSRCRLPLGAMKCLAKLTLRIRCDDEAEAAVLRFYDGSEKWFPMDRTEGNWFQVTIDMPDIPILCWYDFRIRNRQGQMFSYGCPSDGMGGEGFITDKPRAWQITTYAADYKTPEYLRHGVMYQIFPDRFSKSGKNNHRRSENYYHENWNETPILIPEGQDDNCARDFFGGDLKGIESKLQYLKDMGVTVLYLNPIFMARSNHRYDTADYMHIDSHLGTDEDFRSLCETAKHLGIRVMLDGVFSHTGEDSIYFNRFGRFPTVGACQSTQSPYYPWYQFKRYPDEYECWWGFHTLPAMDKECESYREYMFNENGVVRHWVRQGSCGWRLDVADELSMRFLRSLREAVKKEDEDAVVLGEVWEDASHKEAYGEMRCYCQGDTLDSVMNYPLREAANDFFTGKTTSAGLKRLIMSQQENYPAPFHYSLMNLCGSHDRPRAINVLCERTWEDKPYQERGEYHLTDEEYALGRKRFIEMTRLMCALPGIPCLYYGDEVGMQGSSDPYCRGTYPWDGGDQELKEIISKLLIERRDSAILHTGFLSVETPDDDTIRIIRRFENGQDVFGDAALDDEVIIEISRK